VSSSFTSKLWLVAALFVQTAFAPWITVHGALPSFATIVVVLYALRVGARRAVLLGALAGILTDVISGTGGGWTLAYLAIALGSGAVRAVVFADGIVMPSIVVAAAVLVRNALFWIVMTAEGYPRGFGTLHLHVAMEQALFTGLVAAVVQLIRARLGDPADGVARYA
jgi:rod shape-determining protein MreD